MGLILNWFRAEGKISAGIVEAFLDEGVGRAPVGESPHYVMSLATRRPLYLVGAFGGAAHAVIETLEGDGPRLADAMKNVTGARTDYQVVG